MNKDNLKILEGRIEDKLKLPRINIPKPQTQSLDMFSPQKFGTKRDTEKERIHTVESEVRSYLSANNSKAELIPGTIRYEMLNNNT